MQAFTVALFGHRDFSKHFEYEKKLKQLILKLLREKEYVEFLVGRHGEFDIFSASVVRLVKSEFGCNNCSLILVLPYMTAEFRNNQKEFYDYYDEIEICPQSEKTHPKSAIMVRNKCMIVRSDLVICYIERNCGGAYAAKQYAEKNEKRIMLL